MVVVVNRIEHVSAVLLFQFHVLHGINHWNLAVNLTRQFVEHVYEFLFAGESVGAIHVFMVEDKDVVAYQIIGFPDHVPAIDAVAVEFAAFTVNAIRITGACHIEQQIMVVGIPPYILYLTIMVSADLAEVDSLKRLLVLVVENHLKVVGCAAGRSSVKRHPSHVDGFCDKQFQSFHTRNSWQVGALHILAHTVNITVGLIDERNHCMIPSRTETIHRNKPLCTDGGKHEGKYCKANDSFSHILLGIFAILIANIRKSL